MNSVHVLDPQGSSFTLQVKLDSHCSLNLDGLADLSNVQCPLSTKVEKLGLGTRNYGSGTFF